MSRRGRQDPIAGTTLGLPPAHTAPPERQYQNTGSADT